MTNDNKMLIVDDDKQILTMLKFLFTTKGYEVIVTTNAKDAIKAAHEEHPDVILLDLKMPGMDGCTFVKKTSLMDDINDIPIVILTAMGTSRRTCLLSQGVCDYIEKPFQSTKLVKAIEEAIKKSCNKRRD